MQLRGLDACTSEDKNNYKINALIILSYKVIAA